MNRFTSLPDEVTDFDSLQALKMRTNHLRQIPQNVGLMKNLTYLDLSENYLKSLPQCIFELPLEILLLAGNQFDSIPREIRQLFTSLTELDLSYNFLTSIPADIALLKYLRVLNLRRNKLDQFPSELCRLSLQILDISMNNFTTLPLHLRKMKTLVELNIEENPLVAPPMSVVVKGREHIFKWMDRESAGVNSNNLSPSRPLLSMRQLDLQRTTVALGLDEKTLMSSSIGVVTRKTSSTVNPSDRRARNSRYNTVVGSDSGYTSIASNTDEHRLSHELAVNGVLDETNEFNSPSPDEGIQISDKEVVKPKMIQSVDVKQFIDKKTNSSNADHVLSSNNRLKMTSSVSSDADSTLTRKEVKPVASKATSNLDKNGNAEHTTNLKSTQIDNADISNANMSKSTTKPVSKVAPLVNPVKAKVSTTTTPSIQKPQKINVDKPKDPKDIKPSPPSNPPRKTITTTTSLAKKPIGISATNLASKTKSVSNSTSNLKSSRSSMESDVSKKTPTASSSSIASSRKPSVPATSRIQNPTSTSNPSTSSGSTSTFSSPVETIRKLFMDKLGISLSSNREEMAAELSDGVHLCSLANALKARSVSAVVTPKEGSPLSPMKAQSNVDSFLGVCRRSGVPENTLCIASDVVGRRNIDRTLRTIAAFANRSNKTSPIISKTTKPSFTILSSKSSTDKKPAASIAKKTPPPQKTAPLAVTEAHLITDV
ncbi:hypothetical protein WR25_09550 isoform D [Diploscapter pachys]|nr:hypothetical protein WR25_09550 isoform B [Diploscapter pachys]PAV78495.1 hypothetical protein WR25_09550 isoform D [Diploscapter pachys]